MGTKLGKLIKAHDKILKNERKFTKVVKKIVINQRN